MTLKKKRTMLIAICMAIAIIMITLFLTIKSDLNKVVEDLTVSDVYSDMYEETT